MFLQASVILPSMHHWSHDRGLWGFCLLAGEGCLPPGGKGGGRGGRGGCLHQDTVNRRTVRILLECILVYCKNVRSSRSKYNEQND